jgi:hypothetical protein
MSLESATQFALFLAGIWAATKAMLDATAFVNALRDTVVIGRKDGETLTHSHRRTLRNDWLLTMIGAVLFPAMYSAFLFVITFAGTADLAVPFQFVLGGVACIPLIGSVLFVICGVGDWRLMQQALEKREGPSKDLRVSGS